MQILPPCPGVEPLSDQSHGVSSGCVGKPQGGSMRTDWLWLVVMKIIDWRWISIVLGHLSTGSALVDKPGSTTNKPISSLTSDLIRCCSSQLAQAEECLLPISSTIEQEGQRRFTSVAQHQPRYSSSNHLPDILPNQNQN